MEFSKLVQHRYSCRSFSTRKVEKETILKILQAAQAAPSAVNAQPFHLLVLQDEKQLEKVGQATKDRGAPLIIIVCTKPTEAWVNPYTKQDSSLIDASIISDHMILQATALDLNSLWVCWFKPDVIRREFHIPEYLDPVHILMFGYSDNPEYTPQKKRKSLSDFITYESF